MLKSVVELIFEIESKVAKTWASSAHKRLYQAQWGLKPPPQWFDHSIDVYYLWPTTNIPFWLERGIFNSLGLKNGRLLELTCGDGFNTKHFYSHGAKEIIACDLDASAIKSAKQKNPAPNISYQVADIISGMPNGNFDNVIWDFGWRWCDYFSENEVSIIVGNIKSRLSENGVFSGYNALFGSREIDSFNAIQKHEIDFKNIDSLKKYLLKFFKNVKVIETIYPSRHNMYFWASDSEIPFGDNWGHIV